MRNPLLTVNVCHRFDTSRLVQEDIKDPQASPHAWLKQGPPSSASQRRHQALPLCRGTLAFQCRDTSESKERVSVASNS